MGAILALAEHFGTPFWHLWDNPGGPWEQQDGHEAANDNMLVDFGMISGLVYDIFWGSKCVQNRSFVGLFPVRFLSLSDSNC